MPIRRWRGIMVRTSSRWVSSGVRRERLPPYACGSASWCHPQLVSSGGDGGGYSAGDELLVIGRRKLREIRSLRRYFNGDGWSGDIIQRAERRSQIANRNLASLQFRRYRGGRSVAQLQRGMLSGGPRAKGTAIIISEREQCRIDADAMSARSRVQ